jgi:HlyD family secretion protein
VTIGPLVGGTVTRLHVRQGDRVRSGDTLAEIDSRDLLLQRDQILAGLDLTQAQYDALRNGARPEEIGQAEEGIRQTKVALDNAKDDLRRLEQVASTGAVTEKAVADARNRVELASSAYRSAQLGLSRLRSGSRAEDLRAGRARTSQVEAQLLAIDRKIDDCIVRAPADGIVTTIAVEEGEIALMGGGLMTIARTGSMELAVYLPEGELGRVHVGGKVDIVPDGANAKSYQGRVTFISPEAEFTPKNVQTKEDRVKQVFEVRIAIADPTGELKSGLTAEARFD